MTKGEWVPWKTGVFEEEEVAGAGRILLRRV
jgi:hypothetical protein